MYPVLRMIGTLIVIASLIVGCGSAAAPASRESAAQAPTGGNMAPPPAPAQPADFEESAPGQAPSDQSQTPQVRKIIYTVSLTIRFEDVVVAAEEIKALVSTYGGYIAQSKLNESGQDHYNGTITLRVDATQLDAAIEAIKALGIETLAEESDATDVTEEYVDLGARLENLERTETELQALLTEVRQETRQAEDVLAVYREITQIREQIETIQGRLTYLDTLSALATITITMVPPTTIVTDPGWSVGRTINNALSMLVSGLQLLTEMAVYFLIAIGPLLLLAALPFIALIFGARLAWRRWRQRAGPADRLNTTPSA